MAKRTYTKIRKQNEKRPVADVVSAVLDPKNRDLTNPTAVALLRGARRAAGQTA